MTTDAPTSGRTTVYTGRTTNWPMVAATILGALLIVAMSGNSAGYLALSLALIAVGILAEILTASSVRASAGPSGFDVRWGVFGWPHLTYSLTEIARAEVIDLPWWRVTYGFWWTPRGTSCTLRIGPTVRLRLTNGRTVTVSVPDPHLAVRAIDDARPA